jgi:serine/threonine protein kinase
LSDPSKPIEGIWIEDEAVCLPEAGNWPSVPGYEILEELGRGGMGVVYRARQVTLKREVALKLIRDAALASDQDRGRFRIEAEAVARMSHSNIVQIYEVGEHEGRPYYAMELITGGNLESQISGQPLPSRSAAQLVHKLALAVQHAHARQVIHRDLKPSNILLQKSEVRSQRSEIRSQKSEVGGQESSAPACDPCSLISDLCPKLTDFGLAKRLDSDSTGWTREGAVLGTANYMAPEQAAGRIQEIGPAVDIYALGAILYELLTGRPPFQGDSWNETLQQVLFDEPTPPIRLQAEVPLDLETICLKCLEKQPNRRYAHASDLAEDLERFLEGKAVTAVPLSETERLARQAARDGFEIAGEIGRGPRSLVYRALFGPLHQPVALKVFRQGLCSRDDWEARVRRGADLGATLTHPQVINIQKAGWWDGAPYVAMEYVPQGSLAVISQGHGKKKGKADVAAVLGLVKQIAEIVSYFHRQGAVHGNLKPSNVLLAANQIPRVADFHLSGGLFLGPLPEVINDPEGLFYLAPEMIADPSSEPRPFTDIYGLGLILYELLTGRPPFVGATGREVIEQIRNTDPIPPSHLNSEVTPHLDSVCLRCLRKNPWHRYSRAYSLSMRLQFILDHLDERDL